VIGVLGEYSFSTQPLFSNCSDFSEVSRRPSSCITCPVALMYRETPEPKGASE